MLFIVLGMTFSFVVGYLAFHDYLVLDGDKRKELSWKKDIESKYEHAFNRTNEFVESIEMKFNREEMKRKMVHKQMSLLGVYRMFSTSKSTFSSEQVQAIKDSDLTEEEYNSHIDYCEKHLAHLKQFEVYYYQACID
ncbi:MAG: hypothetical protein FH748_07495 [Balneolaceae bacterium]|nr:hypothetical protein [Balneolaceae bacterium]